MGTGRTLICVSAALALAAGAATAETPKRGGILNFAVVAEPKDVPARILERFSGVVDRISFYRLHGGGEVDWAGLVPALKAG